MTHPTHETHGELESRDARLAAEHAEVSTIWTGAFWRGAAERALKTAMQTFVATITVSAGADLIPAVGVEGIDWIAALSVTAVATVLSIGTSIGNADFTAGK